MSAVACEKCGELVSGDQGLVSLEAAAPHTAHTPTVCRLRQELAAEKEKVRRWQTMFTPEGANKVEELLTIACTLDELAFAYINADDAKPELLKECNDVLHDLHMFLKSEVEKEGGDER